MTPQREPRDADGRDRDLATSNSVSEDAEVAENGEVVPSAAGAGRDEAELIEQHKAVSGVVEPTDLGRRKGVPPGSPR